MLRAIKWCNINASNKKWKAEIDLVHIWVLWQTIFFFSDFKLGPKKGMLSTLSLLFNRTGLVEGLSVGTNFHPQPHSMSDYNVIPIF